MTQEIKLADLYTKIKDSFPQYSHDEKKFVEDIVGEFRKDPIRTRSVMHDLSSKQLNFRIHRAYPLNDFLDGCLEYMVHIGIKRPDAVAFVKSLSSGDVLFQD